MIASFKTPDGDTYVWNEIDDTFITVNGARVWFLNLIDIADAWFATLDSLGCLCETPEHDNCPLSFVEDNTMLARDMRKAGY